MNETLISITAAKQDKLFYVVSNIIIVNPSTRTCLILKRSQTETVHPGKWAFPGGKLEHAEVVTLLKAEAKQPIDGIDNILGKLAEREAKEECGLEVDGEKGAIISNKVFVRPDGVPVFLAIMTATYTGREVVLEAGSFSDYAWVGQEEAVNYDCIEGIADDIKTALELHEATT
jgi:ADP-ribose pyrophosphatase YjhB (NUDIX family)